SNGVFTMGEIDGIGLYDALNLFKSVVYNPLLCKIEFMLYFNKMDIFEEKEKFGKQILAKVQDENSYADSLVDEHSTLGNTYEFGNEDGINFTDDSGSNPRKAQQRNKLINKKLKKERKELINTTLIKVLVLGSADSGKSTLIKQVRILNKMGFSMQEIHEFHVVIIGNLIGSMKKIIKGVEMLKIEIPTELLDEYNKSVEIISSYLWNTSVEVDPEVTEMMIKISKMDVIKEGLKRSTELNSLGIQDTASYFVNNTERILDTMFYPNNQDILLSRRATTTVTSTAVTVSGTEFKFIDVSGQKSQRKTWLPYFEDAAATMFVVDISSYDKNMEEESSTNRLFDAWKLFGEIINNELLANTEFMLFFNKMDLFISKIGTVLETQKT
ncbi:hypothetical protein HDU92_007383, partial [Lobulomyces angularis]